jgi:glycosyltransferase involved in cell wall biosynthesis
MMRGEGIKIGVVTYDFFPFIGGIGRHTYLMFSGLKDPDILFFSPADNSLPHHIRINFWAIRLFKQVGVSIWLFFNVYRIISEYRLDKLNIHSGAGGVLLIQRLPVPVVVTCHHTYWQQYTHIKSQFWKRIFLPFERRTYRLAARIVCVSADTKRILVDRYHIPEEKIIVIHNAVDTDKFYPISNKPKRNIVLYVGRIDKRKGIEFLIRSMPLVVQQIPDALLLVGGKGSHLEKMKALVRRLKLERNVTFLGFVPDDQLNSLYNQARCAAVPSIFEGFGITVIEALAAGTRVVGTDVDGIREILKNEGYGVLVKYGDYSALAGAIISELKNQQRVPPINPEYQVDRFISRYQQVLEETTEMS